MNIGPGLHKDNLVFGFDSGYSTLGNGKSSFKRTPGNKGRPTTNFFTNGHFFNGAGIPQEGGSNAQNDVIQFPNPGNSPYVLRQTMGVYYTEYQINLTSQLSASTTYCLSGWYGESDDYNASSRMFHCRAYSASGAHVALGTGIGTILKTVVVGGITWRFCYATITTPSDYSNSFNWYVGYGGDTYAGARYYTNLQMEQGSYPSSFIDGTRSSTQSVFDLADRANNINAGTVSFTSTDIPTFDGTDDYVSTEKTASELGIYNGAYTMEAVFKLDTTSGDNMVFGTNQTNQYQGLHNGVRNGVFYHAHYSADRSAGSASANTWYHVMWIHTGSQSIMYVNGVAINSLDSHAAFLGTTDIWIGRHWGWYDGDIAVAKIYNKAFSATEVQRNYNSYKTRFGL